MITVLVQLVRLVLEHVSPRRDADVVTQFGGCTLAFLDPPGDLFTFFLSVDSLVGPLLLRVVVVFLVVDGAMQGDVGFYHPVGVVKELSEVPSEAVQVIEDHIGNAVFRVQGVFAHCAEVRTVFDGQATADVCEFPVDREGFSVTVPGATYVLVSQGEVVLLGLARDPAVSHGLSGVGQLNHRALVLYSSFRPV